MRLLNEKLGWKTGFCKLVIRRWNSRRLHCSEQISASFGWIHCSKFARSFLCFNFDRQTKWRKLLNSNDNERIFALSAVQLDGNYDKKRSHRIFIITLIISSLIDWIPFIYTFHGRDYWTKIDRWYSIMQNGYFTRLYADPLFESFTEALRKLGTVEQLFDCIQ